MLAMSIPKGIPEDCNMFRERETCKGEKGLEYPTVVAFRHTPITDTLNLLRRLSRWQSVCILSESD